MKGHGWKRTLLPTFGMHTTLMYHALALHACIMAYASPPNARSIRSSIFERNEFAGGLINSRESIEVNEGNLVGAAWTTL
eukprot:SAG25_NODE_402_length_8471_cov_23.612757_8_plen_80_part_00